MSLEPDSLASFGNIWGNVEWPTILDNYQNGIVTTLEAINANKTTELTLIDITTLEPVPNGKRDIPEDVFCDGSYDIRKSHDYWP